MRAVLACAALVATAAVALPYTYYQPPTAGAACVAVRWVDSEEDAAGPCGGSGRGCYLGPVGGPGQIVAPRPRDFNDHRRLLILGHELMHALGAQHD